MPHANGIKFTFLGPFLYLIDFETSPFFKKTIFFQTKRYIAMITKQLTLRKKNNFSQA